MAEYHAAVCDFCKKHHSLTEGNIEYLDPGRFYYPAHWWVVMPAPQRNTAVVESLHFCSWNCLAEHALSQATKGTVVGL